MNIQYLAIFNHFILTQFNVLISALKVSYDDYKKGTIAKYYEMLDRGSLYNKFVNMFFKRLE